MIDNPTLVISIDTESIWGRMDSDAKAILLNNPKRWRDSIDVLLNLFEKHNIPATWAIVGHLFLDHCKKEDGIAHKNMPRFKKDWYDCDPCTNIYRDPLYYGKDIVEKVISSPVGHEIGYHSFSHVIFSECSREVAEAEIREGIKLAKEFGITLKSFTFPQHQIAHIAILKENRFVVYRGKNAGYWDASQSFFIRKIAGAIDKIIAPPTGPKWMSGIWEIPYSMRFCDTQIPFSILPRAKMGIYRAIKSNTVFHIFLHPWNLLESPSLKDNLDKFLAFVSRKREEGKIHISTMGDLASNLNEKLKVC